MSEIIECVCSIIIGAFTGYVVVSIFEIYNKFEKVQEQLHDLDDRLNLLEHHLRDMNNQSYQTRQVLSDIRSILDGRIGDN